MLVLAAPAIMLVAYAPSNLSIKHAVLPRSVVVSLDIHSHCRRIVLRCICIQKSPSSFSSLLHVHPSPLHCVLFLPCCWCCLFLAIGRLHSFYPSPLVLLVRFSFTTCFPSPHVMTTPCCSPISACFSRCITSFPFIPRRASHLKPLNIYYSPSPVTSL